MSFVAGGRNRKTHRPPSGRFGLLLGGLLGGWCSGWLPGFLRGPGHRAFTPPLPGSAERGHLGSGFPARPHVDDIANVLIFEVLHDVVLVGHSQSGILLPLVAESVPERLACVVWLAGVVLGDGERRTDENPTDMSAATKRAREARERGATPER